MIALLTGSAALVPTARAQEGTAPPPAPGKPGAADPLELLPAIGRIGAEVGLQGGWSENPYSLGSGAQGAGFVNLPLKKVGGGVLSYELVIRFARSTSDRLTITNPLAFLANLAARSLPARLRCRRFCMRHRRGFSPGTTRRVTRLLMTSIVWLRFARGG
ncbi:MAG: hypothetical protein JJE39_04705, partial [Vicinamibacteria bacterium]|nr:hypothetical protein [Vicinamibacteria bacterium]